MHRAAIGIGMCIALLHCLAGCGGDEPSAAEARALELRGLALYADGRWLEAEHAFEQALAAERDDPARTLAVAALALRGSLDFDKSRRLFERVLERDPANAAAHYGLAIALRRMQEHEAALAHLDEARRLAPDDADVAFWLGDTQRLLGDTDAARRTFEALAAADRFDPQPLYKLYMLDRIDSPERAQQFLDREQELIARGFKGRERRDTDEWGALLEPKLDVGAWSPDLPPIAVTYQPVGSVSPAAPRAAGPGDERSALDLGDVDGDCDLDLFVAGAGLFENASDGAGGAIAFGDATAAAGLDDAAAADADDVRFADLDNDGALDLLLVSRAGNRLYRNDGFGRFTDATAEAGIAKPAAVSAVVFDFDHEGDLDLFLVVDVADGARATRLLRNDLPPVPDVEPAPPRPLAFTDVTEEAGVAHRGDGLVAAFADFENGNDTDLVVLGEGEGALFTNRRQGVFEEIGAAAGVRGLRAQRVETGDLDGDGWIDLALVDGDGALATARNRGGVFLDPVPAGADAHALRLVDFDNDGDLDVIALGRGMTLLRNDGDGAFQAESRRIRPQEDFFGAVAGDLDGDGDLDLAMPARGVPAASFWSNEGGDQYGHVTIDLVGHKSNASGIGCKVEALVDGLYVKREVQRAPLHIGTGTFRKLGALLVLWSNGVRQPYADVDLDDASWMANWTRLGGQPDVESACGTSDRLRMTQIVRREGSCPLLYAWNGTTFGYVADALCSSPLGLDVGGGQRALPNPDDWVRIRGEQLRPRDGRYSLRLTEELRELAYVDWTRLVAVDHPRDVDVYTDGQFTFPPFQEFTLHPVREQRPPAGAWDQHGDDVLAKLLARDRDFVDTFARCAAPMQGMAEMHHLTLDLGDLRGKERVRLVLDGWFYWTNSSINRAMHQHGSWRFTPPLLEVGDGKGGFKPAGTVGLPAGDHKVVVCDLTGKMLTDDPRVRITTNCQVYWDQAIVALDGDPDALPVRVTELAPVAADLHYRGYSDRVLPDGKEPHVYDWDRVTTDGSTYARYYGRFSGRFTRYGDVLPLLQAQDDCTVILHHGDVVALEFAVADAPPVPEGWTRTFVLRSFGWAKDGDFHSAGAGTVEPLPFAAMSTYPYPAGERFPDDALHRAWREEWNTRVIDADPLLAAPRRDAPMPPVADPLRLAFTDVTAAAGIDFRHVEGRVLRNLEDTMGPGLAFGDADGDGDDDLYLVQGSGPGEQGPHAIGFAPRNALYRNDGALRFTDVTAGTGTEGDGAKGMGALFADLDEDGDQDLYVSNVGPNVLYRNDGDLRFADVTVSAGVGDAGHGSGIAAGDYDKDGDLDLYAGNYVTIDPANRPTEAPGFARGYVRDDPPSILPMAYPPARNVLYRNDGAMRFTDVTDAAGVADADGKTLGVLFADLDEDGWPDLFCANDVTPNAFFRNRRDGTFESLGFDVGLDDPRGGMGACTLDVDGDRDMDLAVTYWQFEPDALYRNNLVRHDSRKTRVPAFEDIGVTVGIGRPSVGLVGWGMDFGDFDLDGHADALIVNGYTSPDYETTDLCLPQRSLAFLGDGRGGFVLQDALFDRALNGRGLATSDLDGDGDLDVGISQNNGDALLLRTDAPAGRSWLAVALVGSASPNDAAGARVEVTAAGRTMTRWLQIGSSYLSCASKTLHFGLGAAEHFDAVAVFWPSGAVTRVPGGAARRKIVVEERDAGALRNASMEAGAAIESGVKEAR